MSRRTTSAPQWAYLFERFPSFTQTFCYREVAEVERQGLAPWIFSIRKPSGEPDQDFPPGMVERVRYLPEEGDLADEFRWLKRCDRLPEGLRNDESRLKGARDKARIQEAGWLGPQIRAAGIGHVHTHFVGIAARTAYWLHRHYGVGFSFTAHANDVFCPPDPELSITLDELMRTARFVVTVSDFSAGQLRERFPDAAHKIFRVYNGIDTGSFARSRSGGNAVANKNAAAAAEAPLILSVGRYIEKKGFSDLIAACGLLRERGVPFECRIVGEGPLAAELQAAIDGAHLGRDVTLAGPRSMTEIQGLLASAQVFALPCVTETDGGMDNLPTVIAEAMAAGLPVVSTTLAGVPEMVIDGGTGILVPPRSPARLAGALERILREPAVAGAFGREGCVRARALFDVAVTGRAFKRLLLSRTAIRPGRAALWKDPALLWDRWRGNGDSEGT